MQFMGKRQDASSAKGNRKKVGALRRSHLLMAYGPGALVDMPDMSVIMGACDYWDRPIELHEARLETLLGVSKFKMPKPSHDLHVSEGVVKAFRFPYWHYCSKCGKLGPYWQIGSGKNRKKCADPSCNGDLVPSRFLASCNHGHIEDFPYEYWVHQGNHQCPKKNGAHPQMRIEFSARSGGLDAINIICSDCGAMRSMANVTARGRLGTRYCRGMRPWVGNRSEDKDPNGCGGELVVLQRGASNVYYPVSTSALTIPSHRSEFLEDNIKVIEKAYKKKKGNRNKTIDYLELMLEDELEEAGLTAEAVFEEYEREINRANVSIRMRDIFEEEYHALCAPDTEVFDFNTMHVGVPEELDGLVEDVVLVKRLKETLVLRGFTRVSPETSVDVEDEEDVSEEDIMSPFASDQDWLPAMELRGEGVFITISFGALEKWVERVGTRYDAMSNRLDESKRIRCTNFTPEFVMLHTLSHILIRQLTIDCGYSGSSLKERIYSTFPDSDKRMAGILIYTSASDSDGSLGGLARQGSPERLLETFRQALENASWCSSDPICSEQQAQGFESLNYAACHACTLLPETSCAMQNCLLDRAALVGTTDTPDLGFFSSWMDHETIADEDWKQLYALLGPEGEGFAKRMASLGIPVADEAGYDGVEDAMAELAWIDEKICYLLDRQLDEDEKSFRRDGWEVIDSRMSDADIRQVFEGRM